MESTLASPSPRRHLKRLSLVVSPPRNSNPSTPIISSALEASSSREGYFNASPEHSPRSTSPTSFHPPRSASLAVERQRPRSLQDGQMSSGVATLIEQNAELLGKIARKERRLLELREEVKREETSLSALQAEWQGIANRSSRPSSSAAPVSRRSISVSSPLSPSPSQMPRFASPLSPSTSQPAKFALDSARDAARGVKNWVIDAVEAANPQTATDAAIPPLPIVPEEDDDVARSPERTEPPSTVESKRTSTASTFTSFGFNDHRHSESMDSNQTSPDEDDASSSFTSKPSHIRTVGNPPLAAGAGLSSSKQHARRKSTMDNWLSSSVNFATKQLHTINSSEAFKSSKKMLVESVQVLESTIIDAMLENGTVANTTSPASSNSNSPNLKRENSSTGQIRASPPLRKSNSQRHKKGPSVATPKATNTAEWGADWTSW